MAIREELHAWFSTLPGWQQDLVGRLAHATHLDGADLDEARRVIFAAHGALGPDEDAPEPRLVALEDLPGASATGETVRLLQLGSLRGVGLVADDQTLQISETGLTIIYGANGAGKSTYVAALKRICRTVDLDTNIRGNVFAATAPAPTANVEYLHGAERRAQQINLDTPVSIGLEVVSVFDSHCAELYLDRRNTVAFVPSSLLILARLAAAQDVLRREVDNEVARLERALPTFQELQPGTAAHMRVATLTAQTDIEELRRFANLGDAERKRLDEVRAAIATAEARNARADADAARQEASRARGAIRRVNDLAAMVSDEACARLREKVDERDAARESVTKAAAEFDALPRSGVGGDPWKRMWLAAREFVESGDGTFPSSEGEACPLCLQELDQQAADRLQHFEEHVRSSLQVQAQQADAELKATLERLDPDAVPALTDVLSEDVAAREPELARSVQAARDAVEVRMRALQANPRNTAFSPFPAIPEAEVDLWAKGRDDHAEMLIAAADPDGEHALRREVAELEGRDRLRARSDDIDAYIAMMERLERLAQVRTALATNRITTKQRELSAIAVTGALSSALTRELENLSCRHLPVDLEPHTAAGETQVALRLAGAQGAPRVSEILSEGEQRAVALAFFFAEIGLAEHSGGVVVDDPVSSLDDERRAYIAQRLVTEATQRQVIVFTHDLPFMLDLLEQAEKAFLEPRLQGIWRLGMSVGRVDEAPPFAAMKFRQRVNALENRVQHWDEQPDPRDADEAWRRVCDFYADMRTTWERAVEERLFKGVVQRFQREVKTLKLPTVEVTTDLVEAIDGGMTRCSFFVHDAPAGTRTSLPGRTDLARDVAKLREFEQATRGV